MRYVTAFFLASLIFLVWWAYYGMLTVSSYRDLHPAIPFIIGFSLLCPTAAGLYGIKWLLTDEDEPDDWMAA